MKAALFTKPGVLEVLSKPLRTLEPGELLVKVDACGVCGTDVHILEGTSRSTPPVVLGHEYAGIVEDACNASRGADSASGLIGRRVAIDPNISCGKCSFCRRGLVHLCENLRALGVDLDGGMAEYCIVPMSQAYPIPEGMSTQISAFIEPVSCAIHGIDRAGVRTGDTVIIIGAGTIGLLMLQLAKNAGAGKTIVIEPLDEKRKIASALGADQVIDPREAGHRSAAPDAAPGGADVVIECVGRADTMQLAVGLARRGGTVEFFGVSPVGQTIPVEPNQVYFRELTIVGSYINPKTFDRSIAVLAAGKVRIDLFRIDTFPLDGVHDALRCQREGKSIKSIILPHS